MNVINNVQQQNMADRVDTWWSDRRADTASLHCGVKMAPVKNF